MVIRIECPPLSDWNLFSFFKPGYKNTSVTYYLSVRCLPRGVKNMPPLGLENDSAALNNVKILAHLGSYCYLDLFTM